MNLEYSKILNYLRFMQQAIDDILEHTNHLTYDEFVADKAKRQATQLNFIILGENAGKLLFYADKFKNNEHILKLSKNMRNFIAHQYENVNLTLIYATAQNDIPQLKTILENMSEILKNEMNE